MKRTITKRTCAVAVAILTGAAWADLWVSPAGSDASSGAQDAPFKSIQHAVDVAPDEGCVIHLAEGTYVVESGTTPDQMVKVSKPVTIIADGARDKTFLDAENKRRNVWLSASGATLSGVTVKRGYYQNWSQYGGVKVSSGATLTNCIVEANYSYHNDGVLLEGGTVIDCIIRNNTTGTNPNGIGVAMSSGLLANCDIYGNSKPTNAGSSCGAGVYVTGGTVRNCRIHDNHFGVVGYGGVNAAAGIWINGSGVLVTGCEIYGNSASGYGAAVRLSGGKFENSYVYGNGTTNVFTGLSGAVYVEGGTMSNCVVYANDVLHKAGGVHQNGGTVVDSIVYGNAEADYFYAKGTLRNVCTNNPGFRDAIAGDYTLPTAGAFACTFTQDVATVRGDAGGKVKFFAVVTNAPAAATCSWDFGDGATGSGAEVEHNYKPGLWSVRLTVTAGSATATTSAKACVRVYPDTLDVYKTIPEDAEGCVTNDIYAAMKLHPKLMRVHEGTYGTSGCPIWLRESMTIRGVEGRDKVIFNGSDNNYTRVFVLAHTESRVEGVKIYQGNTGDTWQSGGGAIVYSGTISNCWFHNNRSYRAPAFDLQGGVIVDSLVTGYREGGGDSRAAAGEVRGGKLIGCTVTAGSGASVGGSNVRGTVYVHETASVVSNCLIIGNNIGGASKSNPGGGVYMEGGLVANTVITNNIAAKNGGGVYISGGTLRNCLVAGNSVDNSSGAPGGGIYQAGGAVENCTVVKNTATTSGGGLYQTTGTAINSIFYYNEGGNVTASGTVTYSGMTPLVAGDGNTSSEPAFMDAAKNDWRFTSLATDYIDKGTLLDWMAGAVDLAGNGRINGTAPDIGAIEYYPSSDEPFIAAFSSTTLTGGTPLVCDFTATISRYEIADCTFVWDFGDGTAKETKDGVATVRHTYEKAGGFTVTLKVIPPSGSADDPVEVPRAGYITVIPKVCYVSTKGSNTYPYESWEHAATTLADAVAVGSAKVVVTNGTYYARNIVLSRQIELVSLEGPEKTIIKSSEGGYNLMSLSDDSAFLSGFTLRDSSIGDWSESTGGSGLRITAGVASNCIVRNCHKYSCANTYVKGTGKLFDSKLICNTSGAVDATGSGLFVADGGLVSGCVISNNTMVCQAGHGGAGLTMSGGTVTNCLFADNRQTKDYGWCGGANIRGGLVTHCVFSNNVSLSYVGGVQLSHGTLRNSLIVGNTCNGAGSGNGVGGLRLTGDGVAESLTIVDNVAALAGSGVRQTGGILLNTLVYGNASGAELDITGGVQSNCLSSVAFPDGAIDCLAGNPQFMEGGYALSPLSPAKNKGLDQDWMTEALDLAGLDRIQDGRVDIGAYEVDASIVVPFTAKIEVKSTEKLASGKSRVTVKAVYGGNEGAVTFNWKFGDVAEETWTETTEAEITHDYEPGSYTVTLKAYDAGKKEWTEEATATAVALPETCYVAKGEGVKPTYPYVTPETGASSLQDALTVGCSDIVVCPGKYDISEPVNVSRAVTIRGQSLDREAAVIRAPSDINGRRVMNLNHADALVCGITLSGGCMLDGYSGGAILNLTGGTVSNCVMNGGWNYYGSSVFVSNGTIVDSVIRNAGSGHSDQEGTAVTVYGGGLIERCVITNNTCTLKSGSARGEAVCLNGSTARIRNSLIARNTGCCCGGLRVLSASEVVNCTIVSNTARVACGGVRTDSGSCRPNTCANNIVWGNVAPTNPNLDETTVFMYSCAPELTGGAGNVSADPKFRNPAKNDWRLRISSPCVNAGFKACVGAGELDLMRKDRVRGLIPDMGCYENPNDGFLLIVR